MSGLDRELIRHALSVAREQGFAEVELGVEGELFTAKLEPAPKKERARADDSKPLEDDDPGLLAITSTLVGYYRDAKQSLRVGTVVKKGDVVAIVAALGIANEVESKVSGEVVEVLVEANQPVEYGQVLARVKA